MRSRASELEGGEARPISIRLCIACCCMASKASRWAASPARGFAYKFSQLGSSFSRSKSAWLLARASAVRARCCRVSTDNVSPPGVATANDGGLTCAGLVAAFSSFDSAAPRKYNTPT